MYSFRDRLHLTEMLDALNQIEMDTAWETAVLKAPLIRPALEHLLAQTSEV